MIFVIGSVLAGAAACSAKKSDEVAQSAQTLSPAGEPSALRTADAPAAPAASGPGQNEQDRAGLGRDVGKADGTPEGRPRKMIRTGSLTLEVDDYERARAAVERLVKQSGGMVASIEVGRAEGSGAAATLVLRIPEGELDGAVAALGRIGTLTRESIRAEDVSETYYDLAARLRNGKRLEERMVELAAKAGGVKDLLEVEREIGRVREGIEVMEGQMRGLDDRTSLATLTVEIRARVAYVPFEEPGLAGKIDRAFSSSLRGLRDAGEGLLLFLVSALPWLVPIGAAALVLRRRLRRRV